MYCPKCGAANSEDKEYCKECGESFEELSKYNKKVQPVRDLGFFSLVAAIVFFIAMRVYSPLASYVYILYALIALLLISLVIVMIQSIMQKGELCPKCENHEFNEEYCNTCGYKLKDVLGFFRDGSSKLDQNIDIEINRNYINIYGKLNNSALKTMVRKSPLPYYLNKISNIKITDCRGAILSGKCLSFEYEDEDRPQYHEKSHEFMTNYTKGNTVTVPVKKEYVPKIEEILSMDIFNGKRG